MTSNGGPYQTSGDMSNISGVNPAPGVNIYGFVDNEMRGKFFYGSLGAGFFGAVALPTLLIPSTPPPGFQQVGSSAIFVNQAQSYVADPTNPPASNFTTATVGQLFFSVQYQAGSPDAGSPSSFFVDPSTLFFVCAQTAELP